MKTQTTTKSVNGKKAASSSKKNSNQKPGDQLTDPVGDEENVTDSAGGFQEDEIAQRAYAIWLKRGCPEGCDEENWQLAQQELSGSASNAAAT